MAQPGIGNYQVGETVYQGYSRSTAVATGKVVLWNNNILTLTNINGNFVSNLPIHALSSETNYKFTSYIPTPNKQVQIDVVPNPLNANSTSNWVANTKITEY